ncbi:MAG TPA: Fur family transcriptional regulator [Mycobacteriales bacterium]|nr:Fur family transcriptional regulator [Mycobacteriales bacterium]
MNDVDRAAIEAMLRDAGLRVTGPRLTALGVLIEHPHCDMDTVLRLVRQQLGSLSTQAGYDVLAALVQAGLARRIEPAGSAARFEARVADNHHHVVCRVCGRIEDVDCAVGAAPCLEPSQRHGFALDEAEITFWGLCPQCRRSTADRPRRARTGAPTR